MRKASNINDFIRDVTGEPCHILYLRARTRDQSRKGVSPIHLQY